MSSCNIIFHSVTCRLHSVTIFLFVFFRRASVDGYSKEMRIVCYYTNWSVYRPGQAKFSPQNINPYLCTHLVYAFGGFTKENMLKPFDKYQDIEKGGYAKFTGLKTYNKNLKTLIAIGGWNEGSSRFSPMVASPERRKELVKNTIKFLRQNHFDGLDLDWEYPTFRDGGKPRDRDNYAQLVQELREEFDRESEKTGRPRLLLTMAVPAGIEYINKGYDVPKLTRYLDWMNILSYDYHSAFEPAVNHHAPLYSLEEDNEYNYDAELNIDYTIKHYLKLGADPAKLVLGIPTYGRSYTLFNPDAYEIGSPADGPGDMGEATRENGYLAYYEICDYVKNQDWEVDEPNSNVMGPIAFKNNQWVGYDDEKIVKKKAEYVALNNLGGIMFWAIDNDDFRGSCHGKPYPLIEAGKEALLNAYGLTEENLISPPSKPTKLSKTKSRARTTKTSTESSQAASTTRRRRIKQKSDEEITLTNGRKPGETSTYSNLKIVTPAYTTPEPPATPDMGGGFKCEDEGFYPHPKDCKKYYWCLSGAADSGIVAHQFTCPAGLYFNKAADSCDYSQNVLCNKKLQKATTSSTTQKSDVTTPETPSTSQSFISTTRAPPKISAAPSKSTINFRTTTTTTEAYETEYEYEDEEEPNKREESEQDPRVLKELIDLIKKAGGIEELEKQLKLNKEDSTLSSDSTTPSGISKSLYERVLSKTSKNSLSKNSSRNSGGPQGAQGSGNSNQIARGRLQYKTLSRQRPSTDQSIVDSQDELEEENKERGSIRAKSSLEYINIRRPKTGTTTETTEDDGSSRNKILGEIDADTETTSKKNTPHYVNIRRQRPSTTEPSITSSKYSSIRRSTTVSTEPSVDQNDKIRRDSTTESSVVTEKSTSLRYQIIRRGTTTARATIEDETLRTKSTPENAESESLFKTVTLAPSSEQNASTLRYQTISRTTTIPQTSEILNATSTEKDVPTSTAAVLNPEITTLFPDNLNSINSSSSENFITSTYKSTTQSNNSTQISNSPSETETKKKRPILFQPRPFTTTVVSTSTTNPSTTNVNSKISTTRPPFRVGYRRRSTTIRPAVSTSSTNTPASTSRPSPRLTKPSRRKGPPYSRIRPTTRPIESQVSVTRSAQRQSTRYSFMSRKPYLRTTTPKALIYNTTDQFIESSNQEDHPINKIVTRPQVFRLNPKITTTRTSTEPVPTTENVLKISTYKPLIDTTVNPEKETVAITVPFPIENFNPTQLFDISPKFSIENFDRPTALPLLSQDFSSQTITAQDFVNKYVSTRSRSRYSTTTETPFVIITSGPDRNKVPPIFQKTSWKSAIKDYDYYDSIDASIVGKIPEHSKVLLHGNGIIECLDQGNFPHPLSCKKFIYCAKMDSDKIIGWEYTCPKNLSFDPIGGMCNWSAGLGCNEVL
ncbi:hypothetical protein ABEB36_001638 [Hypothenemus hampei]|uniref:Chitinase n=1 Tax=Hypothenemus hampei TaxID=57062 RepID=A0ABD1FF96_HYPHA